MLHSHWKLCEKQCQVKSTLPAAQLFFWATFQKIQDILMVEEKGTRKTLADFFFQQTNSSLRSPTQATVNWTLNVVVFSDKQTMFNDRLRTGSASNKTSRQGLPSKAPSSKVAMFTIFTAETKGARLTGHLHLSTASRPAMTECQVYYHCFRQAPFLHICRSAWLPYRTFILVNLFVLMRAGNPHMSTHLLRNFVNICPCFL